MHYDLTIERIPIIEYHLVASTPRQSEFINMIARNTISIDETSNGGFRNAWSALS